MEEACCWLYKTFLSPVVFRASLPLLPPHLSRKCSSLHRTLLHPHLPLQDGLLNSEHFLFFHLHIKTHLSWVPFSRPVTDGGILHQPQPGGVNLEKWQRGDRWPQAWQQRLPVVGAVLCGDSLHCRSRVKRSGLPGAGTPGDQSSFSTSLGVALGSLSWLLSSHL